MIYSLSTGRAALIADDMTHPIVSDVMITPRSRRSDVSLCPSPANAKATTAPSVEIARVLKFDTKGDCTSAFRNVFHSGKDV